jgi:PAS domain S-box-containing protein
MTGTSPISVLYVDDEPSLLEIARIFLERSGDMRVDTALSAVDGLGKLKNQAYDAIVADYQMPDMDGIVFLKLINDTGLGIPFILFTGRGREEVVIEAINNGAAFYLQKGGDPKAQFAELAHKIRQAVARKQAEEALRESEENYRALFDEAADLIAIVDSTGKFLDLNRRYEEESGYSKPEMIGKNALTCGIVTTESAAKIAFHLGQARLGLTPPIFEIEGIRKDGAVIPFEIRATPIMKNGKVAYIQAILRNLTERRGVLEAMRLSEELHRTLFLISPDGITLTDSLGVITYASPAALALFGLSSEKEAVGTPIFDWIAPEVREEVRTQVFRFIEEKAAPSHGRLFPLIRKDGTRFFAEISSAVLSGDTGKPTGMMSILRDVTGRTESDERLRQSEELHRTFFQASPDGIAIADLDGRITFVSPKAVTLVGAGSEEEVLGTLIFDWIAPELRENARARIGRLISSGRPGAHSYRVLRKDGSSFYAEISGSLLHDAHGKPKAVISILRDVTDRIIAEEALQRASAKLNLLSAITRHDILNKLTVLVGYLGLAQQAKSKEMVQDFLRKIDEIAGVLVDQIEFTKDYQDLGIKRPEWQDLSSVFTRAAGQLDLGTVRVLNEAEGVEIYADPLFQKVVYNIIDNAIRYGGKITAIRLHCRTDNGDLVWIIEDDGVGIPAKDKSNIFAKGFGKHTGLGLFLAREILAITGMTIMETGFPGKGARFEVYVPKGNYRMKKTG